MGARRRPTGSFEVERTTGSQSVLDRLFVYGTLRQGQTARSLIANAVTRCVTAYTRGNIYSFPMGYPGFAEAEGEGQGQGQVVGDLLWLSDLAATFGLIDAYEGADFVRTVRLVTTEAGEELWAWIYVLADPETARLGTLIADGDWVRYCARQA